MITQHTSVARLHSEHLLRQFVAIGISFYFMVMKIVFMYSNYDINFFNC